MIYEVEIAVKLRFDFDLMECGMLECYGYQRTESNIVG
jgi:hypothetical protein